MKLLFSTLALISLSTACQSSDDSTSLVNLAGDSAAERKFSCSGVGGTDEWTIYVDLDKKLAGFFDNDNTVIVPMTEFKSLESNPPQSLYIFEGKDIGGGDDEKLRIYFNKTKMSGSILLGLGSDDETHLDAEHGCEADDDIDL